MGQISCAFGNGHCFDSAKKSYVASNIVFVLMKDDFFLSIVTHLLNMFFNKKFNVVELF